LYPGWYSKFGILDAGIRDRAKEAGKRIALSEYGAGSNAGQHDEGPLAQPDIRGSFHPEEWQTYVHETDWAGIKDNPLLWGSFIWAMFDFQVGWRHEGSLAKLNDKGLVTQDRKTKKDSYYLYQANWSDGPMVHIASKRMTPRHGAVTDVQVFSNCAAVNLSVNGVLLGLARPDRVNVFRWSHVQLEDGKNEIVATATSSQGEISDYCEWNLYQDAALPKPP
jgi:beta-galactosidase